MFVLLFLFFTLMADFSTDPFHTKRDNFQRKIKNTKFHIYNNYQRERERKREREKERERERERERDSQLIVILIFDFPWNMKYLKVANLLFFSFFLMFF